RINEAPMNIAVKRDLIGQAKLWLVSGKNNSQTTNVSARKNWTTPMPEMERGLGSIHLSSLDSGREQQHEGDDQHDRRGNSAREIRPEQCPSKDMDGERVH